MGSLECIDTSLLQELLLSKELLNLLLGDLILSTFKGDLTNHK